MHQPGPLLHRSPLSGGDGGHLPLGLGAELNAALGFDLPLNDHLAGHRLGA